MKKFLYIGIGIVIIGVLGFIIPPPDGFWGDKPVTLTSIVSNLQTQQESYKTVNGKYLRVPNKKIGDYEVEVQEHYNPTTGKSGYTILIEQNGAYKIQGYGIAESLTHDWIFPEEIASK